ncbi:hypothetical protein HRI_001813000 [Hibiscus trionum]|uniref:Uncharacterized protein n=1 Tax=Hibiscus trionum TaxID=183268 RepID=A0A9W7LXF7_HIBTR|nr:hypothetical protein HRI_001813000 [Hibiscus trionum]
MFLSLGTIPWPCHIQVCWLVASIPSPCFSRKQSMFAGHLIVDELKSLREMKEAVSTSHCSQPNTLEYDLTVGWCLMTETSTH